MKLIQFFLLVVLCVQASAQPDLVITTLYTDSLCAGIAPYYSINFSVKNIGDEVSDYFCHEVNGQEVCPDTTNGNYPLYPEGVRSFSIGLFSNNDFGGYLNVEIVGDTDELNTENNSQGMTVPDVHQCYVDVDFGVDTILYETGCDVYGPYLQPSIFVSNQGVEDITEFCVKFQVLGQTNDTVCFTGLTYLPLMAGDSAVQQWPRVYVDGVLSFYLLDVNGPADYWWLSFGQDENSYNNTYVEVLPNLSDSWCVSGCTDINSTNYNPLAVVDDGSCIPIICGCIIPVAINYDPLANTQCLPIEESCVFEEGCGDEAACNYAGDMVLDDGSCEYPELGYDCDGECEYDTDQDGVCDQFEIPGCTEPSASNYNSEATDDDGSCEFTSIVVNVENGFGSGLYPNPVYDTLNLVLPQGCYVDIYDLNGKIMMSGVRSKTVDVSRLPNGLYEVFFFYGNSVVKKTIIKQ